MKKLMGFFKERKIILIISILYLIFSVFLTSKFVMGSWDIQIDDVKFQKYHDPGAHYIATGVNYFEEDKIYWAGHPGYPLMITIDLVTNLIHFIDGQGDTYENIIVRKYSSIVTLTKIFITIFHILSFFIIYEVFKLISKSNNLANLTTIAYSTSFAVLFYFNFISVEPFIVLFLYLSIFYILKFYKFEKNKIKSYSFLALSSFFAVTSAFSKMTLVTPILISFPLLILLFPRNMVLTNKISFKYRIIGFIVFIISTFISWKIWAIKLDWNRFIEFWFRYSTQRGKFDQSLNANENLIDKLMNFLGQFFDKIVVFFNPNNFFLIDHSDSVFQFASRFEILFFILFWIGLFTILIKKDLLLKNLILLITILSIFPLASNRFGFHYFMVLLPIVFYFGFIFLEKRIKNTSLLIILVFLLHSPVFYGIYKLNLHNIKQYNSSYKAYFTALDNLNMGKKIAILNANPPQGVFGNVDNFLDPNRREYPRAMYKNFVMLNKSYPDDILKQNNIQFVITGEKLEEPDPNQNIYFHNIKIAKEFN